MRLDDHAEIILTDNRGREKARARIDLEDVEAVSGHRWCATPVDHTTYVRGYPAGERAGGMVYLHRFLVDPAEVDDATEVDHWDGDGLNNRRANLKAVSRRLNTQNKRANALNKSGRHGVCWSPHRKKWVAQIGHEGRVIPLGAFDDLDEAARVAREAREQLHENHQVRPG